MKNKIVISLILVLFLVTVGIYAIIQLTKKTVPTDSVNSISDESTAQATDTPTPTPEPTPESVVMGKLTIIYKDKYNDGKPVNGSTISIKNKTTLEEIVVPISQDGILEQELPVGDYEVKETSPAPGYTANDKVQPVLLTASESELPPSATINFESVTIEDAAKEENKQAAAGNDLLPTESTTDPGIVNIPKSSEKPADLIPQQNTEKTDQTANTANTANPNKTTNPKTADEFSIIVASTIGAFSVAFIGYLFVLKKRFYS